MAGGDLGLLTPTDFAQLPFPPKVRLFAGLPWKERLVPPKGRLFVGLVSLEYVCFA